MSWETTLEDTLAEVWRRLARGVADRRAPARHPTIATVDASGAPTLRTVVLRAADRAAATLEIHTDSASAKAAHLARDPRAALHVWEPRARLQLRLAARAEALAGAEAEARWAKIPEGARLAYGGAPAPGAPLDRPEAHDPAPDHARFLPLRLHVEEIETLHLGEDRHRRARFRAADGWAGRWIAP
jgi:pyridoxine/pyridoxamine 5'-phosphate oxidase